MVRVIFRVFASPNSGCKIHAFFKSRHFSTHYTHFTMAGYSGNLKEDLTLRVSNLSLSTEAYRRLYSTLEQALQDAGIGQYGLKATSNKERLIQTLQEQNIVEKANITEYYSGLQSDRRLQFLLTVAYRCVRNTRRRQKRREQGTIANKPLTRC
jgi:hypothetical protein